MKEARSKDKILKRIRQALSQKNENPYLDINHNSSVYPEFTDSLDIIFAQEFTKINGNFAYCENIEELEKNLLLLISDKKWNSLFCKDKKLQEILKKIKVPFFHKEEDLVDLDASITNCEFLIARLGSILISSQQDSGRRLNIFPPVQIVIAHSNQIVADIKDAFNAIKNKYKKELPSMISIITGPSRTADIEKTLVMGAHGPKEIFVLLIDNNNE